MNILPWLLPLLLVLPLKAQVMRPSPLVLLDPYFSHHVIVVEKATHKLHLYANKDGSPELVKTYSIATGKKSGNKIFQGDHRTPEGIYHFVDFLTHQQLLNRHGKKGNIYGVGAFVMNYPNPIDQRNNKTGGGIWLHSTNNETRIEKGLDSRGCIVAINKELIEISKIIELNRTQIVVVENLSHYSIENWNKQKQSLTQFINSWHDSWQNENINKYLSHYHPSQFDHPIRGSFNSFSRYKTAVFSRKGKPKIELKNLSIMTTSEYAVATFLQNYKSNSINDLGKKMLYLVKDEFYQWKIVGEYWSKAPPQENSLAFRPSNRFFKTTNPTKIMEFISIQTGGNSSDSEAQ